MKISDWLVYSLIALLTAASLWGMNQNKVEVLQGQVKDLQTFQINTVDRLGRMEEKLDTILIMVKHDRH